MSVGTDIIYEYDGTMEGFYSAVFESYSKKEIPLDIVPSWCAQNTLFGSVRKIETDEGKAMRVKRGIKEKISASALELVELSFFSMLKQRERVTLDFLYLGFKYGYRVMGMEECKAVISLKNAVRNLLREAHLLKGFVRFSEYKLDGGRILVSVIGPKNRVLPFLAPHFRGRLPMEHWLIYDEVHLEALVYRPRETAIIPMDEFRLAPLDEEEKAYRALWRGFYEAIEIKPRHNEKCRMSCMPKRYWRYMTEFTADEGIRYKVLNNNK